MGRFVGSKWIKTKALLKSEAISKHIPKTVRMTSASLKAMLVQFRMVYIKPVNGTFGNGVMRVEMEGESKFRYQVGVIARSFSSFDSMYRDILKTTRGKSYLAQKGIDLLKHHHKRFDLRVMVQKNLQKKWEATGVIGRVAHPKKIVTNYHSGGKIKPVEVLLASYLPSPANKSYIQKLKTLGVQVAQQLHTDFPGIKEIGVDVAMDRELKPWILEVNTSPDPYIFRRLSNKAVFGKIMRYARAYKKV